jgi:hypothetical protein
MTKLTNAWPIQFETDQLISLREISRKNFKTPVCRLTRIATDFLIRVTDLNGGQIPALDQVRLQQRLIRRARKDAKRK